MKYDLPESEDEILPNILDLTSIKEIALSEFEGFLRAEIQLTESLSNNTKFSVRYILQIHKLALGHLYTFAGKYRNVNISKGGFPFAAARFLPESMKTFEVEVLSNLPDQYLNKDDLIKDIAIVHGELLFIHPFREGNGRTARILANLMCRKQGYNALNFQLITGKVPFDNYVAAIQSAANKNYIKMEELIRSIFPG